MPGIGNLVRSQYIKLPQRGTRFTGKTIIVTGSNCGLGLAAAREFVHLDAAKVILAVRSLEKGEEAARDINRTEGRPGIVEVWQLDLASYASVKALAERASHLDRLDVLVQNAGVYTYNFSTAEEDELTITVNVISNMLLCLLLLPKLRATSEEHSTRTVLANVGSWVHAITKFPERHNKDIYLALRDEKSANMIDRYNVSKLIQLLVLREFAVEMAQSQKSGKVVSSTLNPGWVATNIMREASGLFFTTWIWFGSRFIARTPEQGARTIIHAAYGDLETHGQYLSDCEVAEPHEFVRSAEGEKVGKQLWQDLKAKMESISPGVTRHI